MRVRFCRAAGRDAGHARGCAGDRNSEAATQRLRACARRQAEVRQRQNLPLRDRAATSSAPHAVLVGAAIKQQGTALAKLIHSMIRVLDEARSVEFYRNAFGLDVAERLDFGTFTLVYLSNPESEFELELTVNKGRTEPYAPGDGYGHLAVSVSDLDAEHARLAALGLNPGRIVELDRDGMLLARFFFITDPDGYKLEVLQRHGRYI